MTTLDSEKRLPRRAPLVPGHWLIGLSLSMRNDPLGVMDGAFAQFGGEAVFLKLGPYRATLVRHPDLIKRVFIDNADNYTKQTRGYEKAKLVLGHGLVTSEGELWQRQRRIATPAFSRSRVTSFASTMVDATTAMLDEWRTRAREGTPIDVFAEMMRVTLHIAVQTLLGVGPSDELNRVSAAVSEVLERTNDIITNPLSPPVWTPLPKYRRFKTSLKILDDFVYSTIAAKRRTADPVARSTDLLSMLIDARDEATGEGMSDLQLRDEAVTILIAGHETTANVLSWALYLLGQHPEIQQQVRDEVSSVLHGVPPTADAVARLPLVAAVVNEAMRLYPPAWMLGRSAKADDTLGDFAVKAGQFVLVSPYITHRHPGLWDRPTEFDPTRFLNGRSDKLPKFSYLPFGGGQRFCIGSHFASIQASLMLATIIQRYELTPLANHVVKPYAMITLRPKWGIKMLAKEA
jgi:cytochrome P450